MKLTDRQNDAVFQRGKTLLVSAAAGSGKTSVLTKRIVELIEEGADIRSMLICTFTNEAVKELRSRIADALLERSSDTGNIRLRAQAEYTPAADICTIHKFAIKVIRENFMEIGVPQAMRIIDDAEKDVLRSKAFSAAVNEMYQKNKKGISLLRTEFSGRTDRELREVMFFLYDFMMSRPERTNWIKNLKFETADDFFNRFMETAEEKALAALDMLEKCIPIGVELGNERQMENDQNDIFAVKAVLQAIRRKDLPAIDSLLKDVKIAALARGTGEFYGDLKKNARSILKDLGENSFTDINYKLSSELKFTKRICDALTELIDLMDREYFALKMDKNAMDFDDTQHFALEALRNPEIAQKYREKYDYIFIDEYQDTNFLQESLLVSIARDDNMFMVGDMKQSIYRFRLAAPDIFKGKAHRFMPEGKLIYMNENFRSSKRVIEMVNGVMSEIMSEKLGEIEYTNDEALAPMLGVCGKAEVLLTETETDDYEENSTAIEKEAETIAAYIIDEVLKGNITDRDTGEERQTEYGDICILARSRAAFDIFKKTFEKYGISAVSDGHSAEPTEIEIFMNFLRLTDGVFSDVALLSSMRFWGFDEKELACIRTGSADGSTFYSAFLQKCTYDSDLGKKCLEFKELIEKFALYARNLPVEESILRIKNELNFDLIMNSLPPASKGYEFKAFIDSILGCPDYAKESMFALISYMDDIKKERGAYSTAERSKECNAVRMMTVHGSKGLEFPIVIIARSSAKFNDKDLAKKLLIHPDFGIALDEIDEKTNIKHNTYMRQILKERLKEESRSEELRVLYVAMTRARDRLIVSGTVKNVENTFAKIAEASEYEKRNANNALEWILCAAKQNIFEVINANGLKAKKADLKKKVLISEWMKNAENVCGHKFFEYKEEKLPSKIGVSTLKAQFIDEEPETKHYVRRTSEFTGAQLGTIIHSVLEHIPFDLCTDDQLIDAIGSMNHKEILTESEAEAAVKNRRMILNFLHSDIAYRIRASENVMREIPFCLAVPACELGMGSSEEKILVQGIIDMAFEENGQLVLVDYKTDNVDNLGIAPMIKKYETQIQIYKKALETITKKRVKDKYLYFLRTGECIDMCI